MRWLAAAIVMIGGCNMPVDPDTDSAGQVTNFGNGSLTFAVPRSGVFTDPTYLPDWAPQYPGSKVRSKLVQRDADGVIGRGTDLETNAPFGDVVDFYADAIARSGRTPVLRNRVKTVASFVFEQANGYNNSIIIRELTGGEPAKVTITIAVATNK